MRDDQTKGWVEAFYLFAPRECKEHNWGTFLKSCAIGTHALGLNLHIIKT